MLKNFTLEYWKDEGWFVGKLKEVPGVFSQGETLEELEENIKEVFSLMKQESDEIPNLQIQTKELVLDI